MTDGEKWGVALQHARERDVDARAIRGRGLSLNGFSAIMEEWYVRARPTYFVVKPIEGGVDIQFPHDDDAKMVESLCSDLQKRWKGQR